jgi:hypothetical protein
MPHCHLQQAVNVPHLALLTLNAPPSLWGSIRNRDAEVQPPLTSPLT